MNFKVSSLVLFVLVMSGRLSAQQINQLTANQVIDLIKNNVHCAWSSETVDTFKSGNPGDVVTGITTCMFADMKVLRKAVADRANLIITHEPTFYNHPDETKDLQNDPVYQDKIKYINNHQLIIWRFHDHFHRMKPDGIYAGMNYCAKWLKGFIPQDIKIQYVENGSSFKTY